MQDGKAAGSPADRPRELRPAPQNRMGEAGAAGPAFTTAARVWTWFLETKRWRKLNEDTPPCFLAVGSGPRALVPVLLEIDDVVSASRFGDRDRDFRR
jgi:hypothetical protein